MSKNAEGVKDYIQKWIYNIDNHVEYLKMVGSDKLNSFVLNDGAKHA
jgi:hypothetical protein